MYDNLGNLPYNIHGGINEDPQQDYIEHRVCLYSQVQLKIK